MKAIRANDKLTGNNCYITGHSLGGGLASAAAIASGEFLCYTFNSAGLHTNTVETYLNIAMPPIPIGYITDYQVDFDILTGIQNVADGWLLRPVLGNNVPTAVGTPIEINSSRKVAMTIARIARWGTAMGAVAGFVAGGGPAGALTGAQVGSLISATGHAWAVAIAIECHMMPQCIYGMERRIFGSAVLIVQ